MKAFTAIFALSIFSALTPLVAQLPEESGDPTATPTPSPTPPDQTPAPEGLTPKAKETFEKLQSLDEEERETFFGHLQEAHRLQNPENRRTLEALLELHSAEQILPYHLNVLLTKGACLVQIRDFDRAAQYFDTANEIYPNRWELAFNRAEMDFVRGNWQEAKERFNDLLTTYADILGEDTRRLVEFKTILCMLQLDEHEEALAAINRYDIYDFSPIHYYGMAAYHFATQEGSKAMEWIEHARRIYQGNQLAIYEDSLVEVGWITVL